MEKMKFKEFNAAVKKEAERLKLGVDVLANKSLHLFSRTNKPLVCVLSGLHGNERTGPVSILRWLREMEKVTFDCSVFPLVNDLGWDSNARQWKEFDLNRSFNQKTGPVFMRQMIRILKASPPAVFLDFHDDPVKDASYVFTYVKDPRVDAYVGKTLNMNCVPWDDAAVWKYCSEVFVRRLGCSSCVTIEAATKLDFDKRTLLNVRIIEKGIEYCSRTHRKGVGSVRKASSQA